MTFVAEDLAVWLWLKENISQISSPTKEVILYHSAENGFCWDDLAVWHGLRENINQINLQQKNSFSVILLRMAFVADDFGCLTWAEREHQPNSSLTREAILYRSAENDCCCRWLWLFDFVRERISAKFIYNKSHSLSCCWMTDLSRMTSVADEFALWLGLRENIHQIHLEQEKSFCIILLRMTVVVDDFGLGWERIPAKLIFIKRIHSLRMTSSHSAENDCCCRWPWLSDFVWERLSAKLISNESHSLSFYCMIDSEQNGFCCRWLWLSDFSGERLSAKFICNKRSHSLSLSREWLLL